MESVTQKVQTISSIGVVNELPELEALMLAAEKGKNVIAYNGFEPSGQMTFAQCMTAVINVNKLTSCGVNFIFWVADTFAEMNNKLGRDMKKIRKAGELMIEIWRVAGMKGISENVQFLWASEEIAKRPTEYWKLVMDVTHAFTLDRMIKCTPALGRTESDNLYMSSLMYAAMQCADVFFLKVDICQMGLDQLKINMLVREYCDKIGRKFKPVTVSHKILGGLDNQDKMSKSNPDTAIFMTDDEASVNRKIKRAFCEPNNPTGPIFDIIENILIPWAIQNGTTFDIVDDTGAIRSFTTKEDLHNAVKDGLHPAVIKPAVMQAINRILEPVREHFAKGESKKLLETVRKYQLTK
jgi:tyrosyl-tRNA synthetase